MLVLADSVWRESAEELTPEAFKWLYAHTFEREITIIVVDTSGVDAREVTFGTLVRPRVTDWVGDPATWGGTHPEWY